MATPTTPPDTDGPPQEDQSVERSTSGAGQRPDQAWREWMMIGVGLTALLSLIALIVSFAALGSSNPHTTMVMAPAGSTPPGKPQAVKLIVKADTEHGKLGSDGKWHDAFLPADFTVRPGARVTVTVVNYDTMPHSFTSSTLSSGQLINQVIPAGAAGSPSTTKFTFTAPASPGKYSWWCAMPCDPWAMSHDGFMRGYVTVAA